MKAVFLLTNLILISCANTTKPADDGTTTIIVVDEDGDGFENIDDCNDNDSTIFPDATELCDGVDNNCDGQIDEGVLSTYYADADGDGFGNSEVSIESCSETDGFVSNGSDCDDLDKDAHPGSTEICDGIDNDCNEEIDEGVGETLYIDNDGDGFGDANQPISACRNTPGVATLAGDCNDNNIVITPLATEYCDGIDNNCNGITDEGVTTTYYLDNDEDGFGDADQPAEACSQPQGYVLDDSDCNDIESFTYPGAIEKCDFEDNNCDGQTDESSSVDASIWYGDGDGDGYGNPNLSFLSCYPPTNYVASGDDCDDGDITIHPGATEVCDSIDNNCDSYTDEQDPNLSDPTTFYLDHDGDGFGDPNISVLRCSAPTNYTTDNTDCNDINAQVFPQAPEQCGTIDHNCDGVIGNIDPLADSSSHVWYADTDIDGFGDPQSTQTSCLQPNGFVADNTDCDDSEQDVSPIGIEICDSIDNDCDSFIDDADPSVTGKSTFYLDHDQDGFGDIDFIVHACVAPNKYISNNTDCDDLNSTTYPGADLGCDFEDHDCDGTPDGDMDEDGYISTTCGELDCNDLNPALYPGAGCPMGMDCLDALSYDPTLPSGMYSIDPDGYNQGNSAFDTYCDMTTGGGGWTLIAVNSFDGSWNTTNVTDNTKFGNAGLTASFKGRGWSEIPFSDLMFSNNTNYAVYNDVSTGVLSYYAFSVSIPMLNCGINTDYEFAMSEGTFSSTTHSSSGTMCNTNLYMRVADHDGSVSSCTDDNESFGPSWSFGNNNGCPLDDPSLFSFDYSGATNPWNGSPLRMWVR